MENRKWSLMPLFAAIAVCVGMSSVSYAQEPRQIEANAQLGIVSGIGTHGSFGGGIGVALTPRVWGYGDFSYIPLGGNSISVVPLNRQTALSARAYNFNLGGRYEFSRSGSMTPYAGLGLGMLRATSSFSSTVGDTTVSSESSSNNLYFNVGGGLRYDVNRRWGWKPEVMVFAGSDTYVRLGGGIFYYFGR